MIRPPALRPGDRVALICPAGPVGEEKIQIADARCRALGFEPVPGRSIRSRAGYLAGTDRERADDLAGAIAGDVAAIWAIRGGYGTLRTLQLVDLAPLVRNPRAFIGFSDNTAIQLALHKLGVVSFHGPHAGHPHFPAATEATFRSVLGRSEAAGVLPVGVEVDAPPVTLVGGAAQGPLVGGNLALLAAACGTPYQPDTRGAILFVEDIAEPLYRIDRMITQLRLAGLLDDIAGIAFGEFTEMPAPVLRGEPGAEPCLEEVLRELIAPLGVPAVLGLPFGHGRENWTLPLGVAARLDADHATLELLEPAVR
ncbi:MAG TPA: LD-carboxypeptidase [Longimicrobiales bacterium]|nr:LD-carboxypeptidase [Longimicrobiales bacterium]